MKNRCFRSMFIINGIFALISVSLILSLATGSVYSAQNVLVNSSNNTYSCKEYSSEEVFSGNNNEITSFLVSQPLCNSLKENIETNEHLLKMSPVILFAAGVLAGFNPCLLAVMALLATITLAHQGKSKEMLEATLGFSLGILTVHVLVGISILSTVSLLPEIRTSFTVITILITALLGFWHIFDAYWLKKNARSTFKTPEALKNFMNGMGEKNLLVFSFLSGSMYSLVKAPCVGAIYLSVLSILATKTDVTKGLMYAGIYNLGLLLPVLGLGFLLAFGLSPNKVTEFREKRRVGIRLMTGIILITVALLMQLRII